ncbi:MAG: hypothetical protein ACP5KE_08110 [Candidatus Methanodesulfokora sp.]|jgi:hypothetical protein
MNLRSAKEASEEDFPIISRLKCPKWERIPRDGRTLRCLAVSNKENYLAYLDLIRSSRGKILLLPDGRGFLEVVPETSRSRMGSFAFLVDFSFDDQQSRDLLLAETRKEFPDMPLDCLVREDAVRYMTSAGFREIERMIRVLAQTRPSSIQYGEKMLEEGDIPLNLVISAGQQGPSGFLWNLSWKRDKIGFPRAIGRRIKVGAEETLLIINPTRDGREADLILWTEPDVGAGEVFETIEAAMRISWENGIEILRCLVFRDLLDVFMASGFQIIGKKIWMRLV